MKNLKERTEKHLRAIEKHGQWRTLKPPQGRSVDLCSNDYLGLAKDERLKAAMIVEIERNGCGATASRLLRGEREVFAEAERKFAEFKGVERSLFFSSGYAANIGLLTTFLESGDVVFSDELNHASLIDGIRLAKAERVVFPHNDVNKLEKLIAETPCRGQRFVVVESLYSMDGDFAPLHDLVELCRISDTNLIVDEAHAVGVFGTNGSGLIEEKDVFLSLNTAGKAFGVGGAFVAGSGWAIEFLIQRCRPFIFSTAPPPAMPAALIKAIEIVQSEPERREKLLNLSQFLREELNANGIAVPLENSQIVPVILGASEKAVKVASDLQNKGFDVRAIRPPTVPMNTARLRISLNADLNEDLLRQFVEALKKSLR